MDLREWLKDVKLKFKKGNKLVSEPKEPLFKKWILEEIKYRYNIGSMRKNNVYLNIGEYNNLDEETIITENWSLDRIAQYFCAGYELMHVDGRNSSFIFLWKNALPIKHMKEIPLLINVLVAYKEYLGGGPNSVLWNKLREEKGHVYTINLYNEINEYTSYHYIASEVNSSRLDAFFRDYCDIMDEFADKSIDDVSFKRLMKGIKNNYYHDKNDAYIAASNIMVNHSLGLPIETLNDYYKKFQQIPKETIREGNSLSFFFLIRVESRYYTYTQI